MIMETNTTVSVQAGPPPLTAEQILDSWLAESGQPVPDPQPLLVGVSLKTPALQFLRNQLERDINAKARGWNPTGFTLLELLEMEQLLSRHADREAHQPGDNRLLTYPELSLLASYVGRHYEIACWEENSLRQNVLADALDALTTQVTLMDSFTPPLPLYHGFFSFLPSLAVLWTRLRAVFGWHRPEHTGNPVGAYGPYHD